MNIDFDKNITNISFALGNDGVHATVLNVTFENFGDLTKIKLYVGVSFPENSNDQSYKREFFRTALDLEKMSSGVYGNSIVEMITRNIFKTSNITMPLKKGHFGFWNFSFPDNFLPSGSPSKACIKIRVVGKFKNKKTSFVASVWEIFIKRV
ncbi:CLUMA_CG002899, isoform A [Clunio marinus]|uniref:CLUMA_CG002899, isoform A n=1 Tax=Clunio marinus TaxID=568069 RepID=A0A1J1HNM7_9DIPT|nr:CLUMA_CG002899, isoform A [Clunio marinus]